MNPLAERVARTVLYEGYILYPYRASSKKNQTRFTFGRVYPRAYSAAQQGAEPFQMQTECLVRPLNGGATRLSVSVRFLHLMARDIGAGGPGEMKAVRELRANGQLYQTWQEAVEREVSPAALEARDDAVEQLFSFPTLRTTEPILDDGRQAGTISRRQEAIDGTVEIRAEAVDTDLSRITVRVSNLTPCPPEALEDQEAILLRTFASAHALLEVQGGEFISLLEPPPDYAQAAAACRNIGAWPVLVGEAGRRDTMLASPIILYDYPEIAAESPGDLCDGTEIDEILTLRIMTMTDEEKHEMRNVDDFARRILERTETLGQDHFWDMHGAMRVAEAAPGEDWFNPGRRVESVVVAGARLKVGDRVRIHPKGRADVMDIALAGRIAIIEAVEEDAESQVHLALVLEDDPGRDLGMLRQPGHRFFFTPQEVEPLGEETRCAS